MDGNKKQQQKDAVTVGQIRARLMRTLDDQINTLSTMIRAGYHELPKAQEFLKMAIPDTLVKLQNLDSWAGLETLFPAEPKK